MTEGQSSRHEELRQYEDDQVALLIGWRDLQRTPSQLNEESQMQQKGIVTPYPFTWKQWPFLASSNNPIYSLLTGEGPLGSIFVIFKALTRSIAGNDALMIDLFVSTLCETAFDWYARLPTGTINS